MADVVDAVTVVQVEAACVIQYRATCGSCGCELWRMASFRRVGVDYIGCVCGVMNIVRRPK